MEQKNKGKSVWSALKGTIRTKPKFYETAEDLWASAVRYFEWADKNHYTKVELHRVGDKITKHKLPIVRPFSMDALCLFCGVSGSYFRMVKKRMSEKEEAGTISEQEKELLYTISLIESIVRSQQIEGGMVGTYNASLTARINGLADNVNQNNTGAPTLKISVRDSKTEENLKKLNDIT